MKSADDGKLCPECKLANSDRPTRKQLIDAVTAAFEPSAVRTLLVALAARNARIRVIDEAGPELDQHLLARPDAAGDETFLALFDNLDEIARYAVFDVYAAKIDSVDRMLRKEFARVFRQ